MTLLRSAVIAYQNGGKNAGKTNCGNEELICLAIAMKENRSRRLKTQLALNSLNARRKRVLNFACSFPNGTSPFFVQFVLVVG